MYHSLTGMCGRDYKLQRRDTPPGSEGAGVLMPLHPLVIGKRLFLVGCKNLRHSWLCVLRQSRIQQPEVSPLTETQILVPESESRELRCVTVGRGRLAAAYVSPAGQQTRGPLWSAQKGSAPSAPSRALTFLSLSDIMLKLSCCGP